MKAWRYLIGMTLAVGLMPGIVCSLPISALALPFGIFNAAWWIVAIAAAVLAACLAMIHFIQNFLENYGQAAARGQLPDDFLVRYLPFALPIFYVLAVIAVAFFLAARYEGGEDWGYADIFVLAALPHYALVNCLVGGIGSFFFDTHVWLIGAVFSLAATVFASALTWNHAVQWKMPATKNRRVGMAILVSTGVVLCVAVCFANGYYHQHVLPRHPWQEGLTMVHDEKGSFEQIRREDKTDLGSFVPFSENNKLVKIENPTLAIKENHPRMHGALALFPVYAAAAQAVYQNYLPEGDYAVPEYVYAGTSPEAFEAVLDGTYDMAFMLRPSDAQMAEAEKRGKTLAITPLGREAFVFFVSQVNPVNDLPSSLIRNIYARKIRRWDEVGGDAQPILAFQRPAGSGSQTAMERFMGDVRLAVPLKEEFQYDMGGIVNRVADYRNYGNSIGYSFRYYVTTMFRHDGVKIIAVDGVEPTVENIRSGAYPLTGELVVVTAGSRNPHVQEMIVWFLSPQGQRLIEDVGYVGMGNEK